MAVPVPSLDPSISGAGAVPSPELSLAGEGHAALDSPARALQERVAADFAAAEAQTPPNQDWSPLARMAVTVAATGLLWAIMLAGAIPHIA
jgi:hypothetical protein